MKKIILFLVAIFALGFAVAYPLTIQLNGNIPFNTNVYHCADSSCNTIGPLYTSGSGNPIAYTLNNEGAGTQYFAEYDYASDRCYVSHSYKNWFDESTGNGPWNYNINLQKQDNCQSKVDSVIFNSVSYDNQTQQITAHIRSPLNLNPSGPQTVPTALEYYYSTNVSVLLEIKNQASSVYTQTISSDVLWGTSKNFIFNLPQINAGNYTLAIKTKVNDCMCNSYVEQTQQGNFTVLPSNQGNQTQPLQNQTNQTSNLPPIANFTYLPIKPNISQTINFDASLSYDSDGTILSYFWNFGDSTNGSGITTTHSYSAVGNYSVMLNVIDDDSNSSSITKSIEVINASQSGQQNQTNTTQPPQNQTNQTTQADIPCTSSTGKKYGKIDNVAINNFILKNNYCGNVSELSLEIYNEQKERMKDVKVIIEIPELNIDEESQYFNLGKFESNWLNFYIKLPNVQGDYYARIKVSSDNSINTFIKKIDINCQTEPAITQISKTASSSKSESSDSQSSGITGNAIAVVKGNVSAAGIWTLFLILLLAVFIARLIFIRKQ